jgi:hypothetical protein
VSYTIYTTTNSNHVNPTSKPAVISSITTKLNNSQLAKIMKSRSMASSAALLVLALALVAATAPQVAEAKKKRAAESGEAAEAKKIQDDFCSTLCEGKKGTDLVVCKESCALSQQSNLVLYGRIQCKGKCTEQKGITAPAMKVCQEECDKAYVVKAAEVTKACSVTCAKEKNPRLSENCKRSCTPPPS